MHALKLSAIVAFLWIIYVDINGLQDATTPAAASTDGVNTATTTQTPGTKNTNPPTATAVDLHEKLFAQYNPDVMPLLNASQAIGVSVQLYLLSFDNLDENKQTVTARAFLELRWRDEFLVWNSSNYGGVKNINVRNENIWLPDMALQNTFDKPTELGQEGDRSVVDESGSAVTWPYKAFTVGCKIKIKKFPFDEHICEFDFLSWTNPVSKLYLKTPTDALQLSKFSESGEWDMAKHEVLHVKVHFSDDAWDHVVFQFTLRRKWLFHVMNMLAPVICIALLNTTCFILPAESQEKITLCISIFLTLAVFLTIVTNALPENSDEMSILGLYVGLQLLGSGLTIVATVTSLYMYHVDVATPVPPVFRVMARLCCIWQPPQHRENNGTVVHANGEIVHDNAANHETELEHAVNVPCHTEKNVEYKRKDIQPYVQKPNITWQMVSRAFDRLCLILGLVWHVGLFTIVIISTQT